MSEAYVRSLLTFRFHFVRLMFVARKPILGIKRPLIYIERKEAHKMLMIISTTVSVLVFDVHAPLVMVL